MTQVLFQTQYKQQKRLRIDDERNKQSSEIDRHQSLQDFSKKDQSKGQVENPSQGQESTGKDQHKHGKEAQTSCMDQRNNLQCCHLRSSGQS